MFDDDTQTPETSEEPSEATLARDIARVQSDSFLTLEELTSMADFYDGARVEWRAGRPDEEYEAEQAVVENWAYRFRTAASMHPSMTFRQLVEWAYTVPSWRNPSLAVLVASDPDVQEMSDDLYDRDRMRAFTFQLAVDPAMDDQEELQTWAVQWLEKDPGWVAGGNRRRGESITMQEFEPFADSLGELTTWLRTLDLDVRAEATVPADIVEQNKNSGWQERWTRIYEENLAVFVTQHPDDRRFIDYLSESRSHLVAPSETAAVLTEWFLENPDEPNVAITHLARAYPPMLAHPGAAPLFANMTMFKLSDLSSDRIYRVVYARWSTATHPSVRALANGWWQHASAQLDALKSKGWQEPLDFDQWLIAMDESLPADIKQQILDDDAVFSADSQDMFQTISQARRVFVQAEHTAFRDRRNGVGEDEVRAKAIEDDDDPEAPWRGGVVRAAIEYAIEKYAAESS